MSQSRTVAETKQYLEQAAESEKPELLKHLGLSAGHNPFHHLEGLDPYQGTPPELLHVALLGFIKRLLLGTRARYFKTNTAIGLAKQSIVDLYNEYDGHRVRGEQLVRYTGSLVGKDFRWAVQVMPLALLWLETTGYGVPFTVLALWATVAELTRMLYCPRLLSYYLTEWTGKLRQLICQYINALQQPEIRRLVGDDSESIDAAASASARPRFKDHILLHISSLLMR
ncbi:hypothetical protein RI367_006335 [Sorochytrium milnesiophthora]